MPAINRRNIYPMSYDFDKVDDKTIDVILKAPEEPILTILAAPSFRGGREES